MKILSGIPLALVILYYFLKRQQFQKKNYQALRNYELRTVHRESLNYTIDKPFYERGLFKLQQSIPDWILLGVGVGIFILTWLVGGN